MAYTRCLFCSGDDSAPDHRAHCDGRQGRREAAALNAGIPFHNVRRSDPDTSYQAAFANSRSRQSQRVRIYLAIYAFGPAGGTDYDVVAVTHVQLNSANKRRGELRDAGLVVDSGRRKLTPSGSDAIVWVASDFAATG